MHIPRLLPRKKLRGQPVGRSRYKIVDVTQPHFMTCTVLYWIPVFTRQETVDIILDTFKHLGKVGFKLYGYVVLENHLHLVAKSKDLQKDMHRFKSYTARGIINFLEENKVTTLLDQFGFYKKAHKDHSRHQLWQEGIHAELIQGTDMMRQKLEYIHNNPVKRGYVELPEHWRYSSAKNYSGEVGLVEVTTEW